MPKGAASTDQPPRQRHRRASESPSAGATPRFVAADPDPPPAPPPASSPSPSFTVPSVELPEWMNSSVSDRAGTGAAVLFVGSVLLAFSGLVSAIFYTGGTWKARVNDMAGAWFMVSVILVLVMVLLSMRSDSASDSLGPVADFPRLVALGVLGMAAFGALVMVLDVFAAIAEMINDFGSGLSSLVDDAALVLFIVTAAVMALNATRSPDTA